jgi:hypothetical protein
MVMHNNISTNDKDKDLMKGMNIFDKTECFGQWIKIRKIYWWNNTWCTKLSLLVQIGQNVTTLFAIISNY